MQSPEMLPKTWAAIAQLAGRKAGGFLHDSPQLTWALGWSGVATTQHEDSKARPAVRIQDLNALLDSQKSLGSPGPCVSLLKQTWLPAVWRSF